MTETNICFTEESLRGISRFIQIDEKENILNSVDSIIETCLRSGFVEEYQMGAELGMLYDIKRLISHLPFRKTEA